MIMMNYTYIVKCADGTFYTGWTNCLQKRMKEHNEGKNGAKYTRTKRPVTLVYYEGFSTKEEAMRREYEIKQFTRNKKLELLSFWTRQIRRIRENEKDDKMACSMRSMCDGQCSGHGSRSTGCYCNTDPDWNTGSGCNTNRDTCTNTHTGGEKWLVWVWNKK